jgi:hypothetical protein
VDVLSSSSPHLGVQDIKAVTSWDLAWRGVNCGEDRAHRIVHRLQTIDHAVSAAVGAGGVGMGGVARGHTVASVRVAAVQVNLCSSSTAVAASSCLC